MSGVTSWKGTHYAWDADDEPIEFEAVWENRGPCYSDHAGDFGPDDWVLVDLEMVEAGVFTPLDNRSDWWTKFENEGPPDVLVQIIEDVVDYDDWDDDFGQGRL